MIRPVVLILSALLAGGIPARAEKEQVVFRSDVSLVRVDAQVVDGGNRAIGGLRAEDFVLFEEGRPQPIRGFARENMPLDVLLLLDVSGSMRPHVQRIASAADEALRVLGSDDRIAIMVFDRRTRVRLPFRSNPAEVERELQRVIDQEAFNGGTDITRALLDAADYVRRNAREQVRRAIVILTDDQTEFGRDEDGVSRALERADTVLCLLLAPDAFGTGGRYPGGSRGGTYPGGYPGGGPLGGPLGDIIFGRRGGYGGRIPGSGPGVGFPDTHSAGTAEIARRSGGDTMPVDNASALETTLSRLRQRYALYFQLPPDVKPGQERNIEVALAQTARRRYPGAQVHYRRVYLAPDAPQEARTSNEQVIDVSHAPAGAPPAVAATPPEDSGSGAAPRRRQAVNEDYGRPGAEIIPTVTQPSGSRRPSEASPQPRGGWPKAAGADPAKPDAETPQAAKTPERRKGWPRATPDQQ
jgi:VWFA-related protein